MTGLPRFEHDDYGTSDAGLLVKSRRLLVRVESLARGTTPDRLWPQATAAQRRALGDMLADLDGPTVYDRLVEDRRFDPLETRA